MIRRTVLVLLVSAIGSRAGMAAEPALDKANLLFASSTINVAWFSPNFFSHGDTSAPQLEQDIRNEKSVLGSFRAIQDEGGAHFAVFDYGRIPFLIHVNSEGQIDRLHLYHAVRTPDQTWNPRRSASSLPPPISPEAAVERVMAHVESEEGSWFTAQFLKERPLSSLQSLISRTTRGLGPYERTMYQGGAYVAEYANGIVFVYVYVNHSGQIDAFHLFAAR